MIKGYSEWLNESSDDDLELEIGTQVEMEHTPSEDVARKIAMAHLKQDPHYYRKLRDAGLIDEPEALLKADDLKEGETSKSHLNTLLDLWDRSDAQMKRRICDAVGDGCDNRESLVDRLKGMSDEDFFKIEKFLDFEEPQ